MFRNKDFDDYVDHSYFDHLGLGKSEDHQLVKSEKKWIAWGAVAACILFHRQIPNLILILIIVIALRIILKR